jgi:catechol 2,3-dioxygenase-like lactoylglutathione lyase family enzyme
MVESIWMSAIDTSDVAIVQRGIDPQTVRRDLHSWHNPGEAAMSATEARSNATADASVGTVDMKLETVVIPVSDVDRAKEFYESLGWRLDADLGGGDFRIVQLTPPGSGCSIQFGTGLTSAAPGTAQCLLVVSDIEAAHDELVGDGVDGSEVFHDGGGGYNRWAPDTRASGPDPERRTYASFAEYSDPDGNLWQLQEITNRLPGRVDPTTTYSSVGDLTSALKRAAAAHGEHEKRTGQADANWPEWYAAYMVAEATGDALPS